MSQVPGLRSSTNAPVVTKVLKTSTKVAITMTFTLSPSLHQRTLTTVTLK